MPDVHVFGKTSYEYAVGCIRANSHRLIQPDQWNRLQEADLETACRIVAEYGYPPVTEGQTIYDSIAAEQQRTLKFVKSIAPEPELIDLLFFEEDAVNLKLYLKAKRLGYDPAALPVGQSGIDPELLRICVYTEDFTLLGECAASMLDGILQEEDPCVMSCRADNAMFCRSLDTAEKKRCTPLAQLLREYGIGRNRITAIRLNRLNRKAEQNKYAFLPVPWSEYQEQDHNKTVEDVLADVEHRLQAVVESLGYEVGPGAIAQYFFNKKNEAAALRMLFTEKSFTCAGGGGSDG